MGKEKNKSILFMILFAVVLIAIDQIVKVLADKLLMDGNFTVIKDFFYMELVYNYGAAFGILKNSRIFFCILTIILILVLEFIYVRMPMDKEYRILRFDIVLCIAGAVGNLIDRIKTGYVIDYIAFDFGSYSFPRFNMADIYICVSAAIFFIAILFYYKDEQLTNLALVLKNKKKDKS